jgi:hypothetical protein
VGREDLWLALGYRLWSQGRYEFGGREHHSRPDWRGGGVNFFVITPSSAVTYDHQAGEPSVCPLFQTLSLSQYYGSIGVHIFWEEKVTEIKRKPLMIKGSDGRLRPAPADVSSSTVIIYTDDHRAVEIIKDKAA